MVVEDIFNLSTASPNVDASFRISGIDRDQYSSWIQKRTLANLLNQATGGSATFPPRGRATLLSVTCFDKSHNPSSIQR